jgi:hypothetical protein
MAFSLTSCATMIRGTSEQLQLSSTPPGAKATLSNGQSCIAPCSLNLPPNASVAVTFSKENCDDQLLSVFPVLAGAGMILGGLIDYGTGAVYSLQPNPVIAALKCREPAQPPVVTTGMISTATLTRQDDAQAVLPVQGGDPPRCANPEVQARCPFYQYRPGVYRVRCQDGSMLIASPGRLEIISPSPDRPHPWDAEVCTIASIRPQ